MKEIKEIMMIKKAIKNLFISAFIIFVLVNSLAYAGRSDAGGGEVKKFDAGDFITNTGLSIAGKYIGGTIEHHSDPLSNAFLGFSNSMAQTQVNRAIGMMGSYYGWDKRATFLISNVATSGVSSYLDPSKIWNDRLKVASFLPTGQTEKLVNINRAALSLAGAPTALIPDKVLVPEAFFTRLVIPKFSVAGNQIEKGMMGGFLNAGVQIALDGDKIKQGISPGIASQIIGSSLSDFSRASFSSKNIDFSSAILRNSASIALTNNMSPKWQSFFKPIIEGKLDGRSKPQTVSDMATGGGFTAVGSSMDKLASELKPLPNLPKKIENK